MKNAYLAKSIPVKTLEEWRNLLIVLGHRYPDDEQVALLEAEVSEYLYSDGGR